MQQIGTGGALVISVWLLVFLSSMIKTIYDDHVQLKEANRLLSKRIAELENPQRCGPDFKPRITNALTASAGPNLQDAMVGVVGKITNLGDPGTVDEFWLEVRLPDSTVVSGEFPVPPRPDQTVTIGKSRDGHDVSLTGAQYWTRTAAQLPIATNSSSEGWLMAVFKGVKSHDLWQQKATVILTCSDANGRKSKAEYAFTGNTTPMFGLGEIQPHKR